MCDKIILCEKDKISLVYDQSKQHLLLKKNNIHIPITTLTQNNNSINDSDYTRLNYIHYEGIWKNNKQYLLYSLAYDIIDKNFYILIKNNDNGKPPHENSAWELLIKNENINIIYTRFDNDIYIKNSVLFVIPFTIATTFNENVYLFDSVNNLLSICKKGFYSYKYNISLELDNNSKDLQNTQFSIELLFTVIDAETGNISQIDTLKKSKDVDLTIYNNGYFSIPEDKTYYITVSINIKSQQIFILKKDTWLYIKQKMS